MTDDNYFELYSALRYINSDQTNPKRNGSFHYTTYKSRRNKRKLDDRILPIIIQHFNVSLDYLLNGDRRREITIIRKGASYVLRQFDLTLNEIGTLLNYDHSTIIYNLKVIDKEIKVNRQLAISLIALKEKLEPILHRYRKINYTFLTRHNNNGGEISNQK